MLISLVMSLLVILIGLVYPGFFARVTSLVSTIDFNAALMKVMVGFLLFAGSMHIDIHQLRKESAVIITFSTVGVLISTFVVAGLKYIVTGWFGIQIDFISCMLFGALISPTDPIAVLGILKKANIPQTLEMKITGESLFNDGVGVVVFATILEIINTGFGNISAAQIGLFFLKEAVGGVLFGLLIGYIGFLALRSIDNYIVELVITLAIVMGGYLLADHLHVSALLAVVAAGIVTGNKSMDQGMSDLTRDYVKKFWEMVDEVLNAILFLLIGFEMLIIPINRAMFWLGCTAIVIVLLARWISVVIPMIFLKYAKTFEKNAIQILTWGGLRGGISVALALSLPKSSFNETFVSITYTVVLFSIIVQGLTIGKLAKKLVV